LTDWPRLPETPGNDLADCSLTAKTVVSYYLAQWEVENFCRVAKQSLGWGDYQMRDLFAVERQCHSAFDGRRWRGIYIGRSTLGGIENDSSGSSTAFVGS
jgi:hypothetical protein